MNHRDRRALVVGCFAVLAAVLVFRVVPRVVRTIEDLRARAVEQIATLERARATVLSAEALRDSLAIALAELVQVAPKLVGSGTAARAGAALSGAVTIAAERGNVRVLEMGLLTDSLGTVFGTVRVHAKLEGDIAGLAFFLAELESGETVLSLDQIVVQNTNHSQDDRASEALRAEVDVRGVFLVEDAA